MARPRALAALRRAVAGLGPSGGEVDRRPPTVVATVPRPDATGVPAGEPIAVEFSEAMDRRRTAEAVYVSPRSEAKLRWRGRRLEIRLAGGLQPRQTYVVTLGSDARDLRGNRLEQSFTFAFATGEELDAGRISGVSPADTAIIAVHLHRLSAHAKSDTLKL